MGALGVLIFYFLTQSPPDTDALVSYSVLYFYQCQLVSGISYNVCFYLRLS